MFFRTPFFLPLLYPSLIWRVPTAEKKIYLTFDDGPVPGPTEFVLEQLKNHQAKATFFCIGNNVDKNSTLFSRIEKEGHAIGNHTYHHIKGWNTSKENYLKDVLACQQLVGETKLFRPPYGRIKRSQLRQLSNYKVVMWDVLSFDYAASMNEARSLSGVIKATRPGSIVVFHDSYKAEKNLRYVLPRFLDHFSAKGFSFDSLSEL